MALSGCRDIEDRRHRADRVAKRQIQSDCPTAKRDPFAISECLAEVDCSRRESAFEAPLEEIWRAATNFRCGPILP